MNIKIKFTTHAKIKIKQRSLSEKDIEPIVKNPEIIENDKFDSSLVHFIGMKKDRYLRVIGRWESNENLLVISSFFDRRLKKRRTKNVKT